MAVYFSRSVPLIESSKLIGKYLTHSETKQLDRVVKKADKLGAEIAKALCAPSIRHFLKNPDSYFPSTEVIKLVCDLIEKQGLARAPEKYRGAEVKQTHLYRSLLALHDVHSLLAMSIDRGESPSMRSRSNSESSRSSQTSLTSQTSLASRYLAKQGFDEVPLSSITFGTGVSHWQVVKGSDTEKAPLNLFSLPEWVTNRVKRTFFNASVPTRSASSESLTPSTMSDIEQRHADQLSGFRTTVSEVLNKHLKLASKETGISVESLEVQVNLAVVDSGGGSVNSGTTFFDPKFSKYLLRHGVEIKADIEAVSRPSRFLMLGLDDSDFSDPRPEDLRLSDRHLVKQLDQLKSYISSATGVKPESRFRMLGGIGSRCTALMSQIRVRLMRVSSATSATSSNRSEISSGESEATRSPLRVDRQPAQKFFKTIVHQDLDGMATSATSSSRSGSSSMESAAMGSLIGGNGNRPNKYFETLTYDLNDVP